MFTVATYAYHVPSVTSRFPIDTVYSASRDGVTEFGAGVGTKESTLNLNPEHPERVSLKAAPRSYLPRRKDRYISIMPDSSTAWFDS